MLIINNKHFKLTDKNLQDREGSDKDAKELEETFEELGYLIRTAENLKAWVRLYLMCITACTHKLFTSKRNFFKTIPKNKECIDKIGINTKCHHCTCCRISCKILIRSKWIQGTMSPWLLQFFPMEMNNSSTVLIVTLWRYEVQMSPTLSNAAILLLIAD